MKKFLTLIMALVFACSAFGLMACENNAGDTAGDACQHSVGADGVCTLCGKDILEKWKAVFEDAESYKGFSEREFTIKTTHCENHIENGVIHIDPTPYITETKNKKNKIYTKEYRVRPDGSFDEEDCHEYYYENLPDENTIIEYAYEYYWKEESEGRPWEKRVISSNSYNDKLAELEMFYGVYIFMGALESMIPIKIEYEDEVFFVYYSAYGGLEEYTITVKDDLIICLEGKMTIGDEVQSVKVEINYGEVNIVFPEGIFVE